MKSKKLKYYLEAIYPILFGVLIEIFFLLFGIHEATIESSAIVILSFMIVTSPLTVPALLLLANYIENDKKIILINKNNQGKIVITDINGKETEIITIVLTKRNPKKDLGFSFLTWTSFYYLNINDGDLYISCLHKNIELINKTNSIEFENYPTIPNSNED